MTCFLFLVYGNNCHNDTFAWTRRQFIYRELKMNIIFGGIKNIFIHYYNFNIMPFVLIIVLFILLFGRILDFYWYKIKIIKKLFFQISVIWNFI